MNRNGPLLLPLLLALAPAALAQSPQPSPAPSNPGVVGVLGGSSGQVTVSTLFRSPSAPKVLIAAHRANHGHWLARVIDWPLERSHGPAERAENSVPAIEGAIRAGAHVVEVDVRATKDGVLVLMHDDTVDRTTDGKGKLEDMTWAEVQRLELVPQGRVPTLADAIRAARGRAVLDLDVKTSRMELVVREIQALQAQDHVLVFESNRDKLRQALQLDPALHVMPRAKDHQDAFALLQAFQPVALHLDGAKDLEDPALIQAAAQTGTRLWVNALGPRDVFGDRLFYRRLARRGAGAIQTDRPDCVARALR